MDAQIVLLVSTLLVLSSVPRGTANLDSLYDEFIEEVINVKRLKTALSDNLPGLDNETSLIVKMLDASTKIPNGIFAGNLFDLGNFDECYGIQYGDIYGKYCLGTLGLSMATERYFDAFKLNSTDKRPIARIHPQPRLGSVSGLRLAACVPSNMSAADIPGLLTYSEESCYSKATAPELSNGAVATIVILAVFLTIAVLSTLFDLYLYYTEKETPNELLIAFSFLTNGSKLFKSTTNPEQLLCLNGIRAISMMWVILGHEFAEAAGSPLYNFLDVPDWKNDSANMLINGATVSVDTFFVVGGLVTVYTFMRSMDKGVKFNVIMYYVHRYLRLTPALGIMMLVHLYLAYYISVGPLWGGIKTSLVDDCETGWWSGLLYITNYVQKGICLGQAWYLSVDMQLYVLSPIVLIPLYRWRKQTLGALGLLAVAGCVVPFAVAYAENLKVQATTPEEGKKSMNDYYTQTYARFGPYVIGMILGYHLYKLKKSELKVVFPKLLAGLLWLVCLTGLVACVYAGFPLTVETEEDRWGDSFYMGFNRPAWAVALSGVIFLCVSGHGHPVDWFLSLPLFQFLTKVSYSMYLMHIFVITVRTSSLKNNIRFSNAAIFHVFWADFMVTLGLSVVLCLLFESPIIILEKHIFGRGATKRTPGDNDGKPKV